MSGATPVMMAVDTQMRDIPNLRSLITSMMRLSNSLRLQTI